MKGGSQEARFDQCRSSYYTLYLNIVHFFRKTKVQSYILIILYVSALVGLFVCTHVDGHFLRRKKDETHPHCGQREQPSNSTIMTAVESGKMVLFEGCEIVAV